MEKTFIIAEAGANHNRDWDTALKLIDVAKESGADAVKFQTYSSNTLYSSNTPDFAGYSNINELMDSIALPREWQSKLKDYCDKVGIEFMSTPFDEDAIKELVSIGVKRLKISGFEGSDPRFVDMVCSTGLPIIMSVGIGFPMQHIGTFLNTFAKYKNDVTLLHCNNAYPTPMEDVDLDVIESLGSFRYPTKVGFSDHTMSTLTPSLAVAKGAVVIEKHFTLDRTMEGPDHPFALEPNELKEMINMVREAEKTIIPQTSEYSKSEEKFKQAKRSVVATRTIKTGEILTEDMITTKRPCLENSIPAIDYFYVLGLPITEDVLIDEILTKKQIPAYYEPRPI